MQEKRRKCKEQCDKDIQKIILKDRIEKELTERLTTLETNIGTNDIPTCICEKSIADKMEKTCLRCGSVFGGGVAPSVGLLGGIGEAAISAWKPKAIAAAIVSAKKAGAAQGAIAGKARGMEVVLHYLEEFGVDKLVPDICKKVSSTGDYTRVINFVEIIIEKRQTMCGATNSTLDTKTCNEIAYNLGTMLRNGNPNLPDNLAVPKVLNRLVGEATQAADAVAKNIGKDVAASITKEKTSEIAATYASWETTIIAAVVAIVVIVLIMVIIYLILRYRRKKKMKKKLQYIKLLEE
ncbi:hypothetical protein PFMALIP_04090 [Plasmodium falciparum MaliPS096_E11]|uniref:Surface antigen n=1 Tax=Plasmodium falciparum MaliPS096_E11 TaxID=1036727 RepID=A0A024WMW8_PLAFA|nr:hypothetical protein PFMALIP_04090 [Plasmodium falciparum MaliPS096_E11]